MHSSYLHCQTTSLMIRPAAILPYLLHQIVVLETQQDCRSSSTLPKKSAKVDLYLAVAGGAAAAPAKVLRVEDF